MGNGNGPARATNGAVTAAPPAGTVAAVVGVAQAQASATVVAPALHLVVVENGASASAFAPLVLVRRKSQKECESIALTGALVLVCVADE